ncbi:heavy metal-associated isoprenylated plant protein 19-like [Malus sylvestris]|uniref:heavy metal-associated isoprenylated plant protein 19-like n=1 Tax=Malus sylvestris TaxID=3752 RepID=UPI0021AD26BF|nr:heavy metal-associated isoprenylated plant protein 19-like [Malus sylvestris]XP_050119847.1 heavy metal-associated isoprenylated plant protein 19-like [Malus sylvestris]
MEALKWTKRKGFGKADQVPLREEVMCLLAELEFSMHCGHCADDVKKGCNKTKGVERVELDKVNKVVIVEGRFRHKKLLKCLRRANKIVNVKRLVMEEI